MAFGLGSVEVRARRVTRPQRAMNDNNVASNSASGFRKFLYKPTNASITSTSIHKAQKAKPASIIYITNVI